MRSFSTLVFVVVSAALAACGRESPVSPSIAPASGPISGGTQISGGERLAWEQRAGSTTELGSIAYYIYVDGDRRTVSDVSCGGLNSESIAVCSARLPVLSAGAHVLALTSVNAQGVESARSGSLQVVVVRTAAMTSDPPADPAPGAAGVLASEGGVRP